MRVRLMGVRGTVPVHGAAYAGFGGATSCTLVEADDQVVILDAGTGLHGQTFRAFTDAKRFSLLISHAHADHLMGLPIFSPLFDSECVCDIYLKTRDGLDAKAQIEALMAPPLWPIRTDGYRAEVEFLDMPQAFSLGTIWAQTLEANHPGGCTMMKLTHGGKTLVYATDYEPESDAPADFLAFARGCDLLLLDGQYTDGEYARTKGFGHSTLRRSAGIAAACGAKQAVIIHHDPNRTDEQLLALERELQTMNTGIRLGREGEEWNL